MNEVLQILKFSGAFIGVWSLVSVGTALVLVPWFRSQARANALMSLHARQEDWSVAAHPVDRDPVVGP